MFELENTNFILYAHVIDVFTKTILVINDTNKIVRMFRNCRLNKLIELDFSHVFYVENDNNFANLVIRVLKTKHKSFWFKKIIFAFVVVVVVTNAMTSSITTNSIDVQFIEFNVSKTFDVMTFVVLTLRNLRKSFANFSNLKFFANFFANFFDELIMSNDVTIHQFVDTKSFVEIVYKYSTLWKNIKFVDLSQKNWMRISLKSNWKKRISNKTKIYSLNARDKKLIDKIFDDLQKQNRLFWINIFTLFNYSTFCVWKIINDEKKNRVIIDIRELNVIIQSNVYFFSLQTNIIFAIRNCFFIFVIDAFDFFYQWRVYSKNRHKLIVVTYRNQKFFNVTIMRYKNFSIYVQRQIDRLLRRFRRFARVYINDIVIFFKIVEKHVLHFRAIFDIFQQNNIFIKFIKAFLKYSFVQFLEQKINFFDLFINEKKLKIIVKLSFSRIFRQLKIYLSLIK